MKKPSNVFRIFTLVLIIAILLLCLYLENFIAFTGWLSALILFNQRNIFVDKTAALLKVVDTLIKGIEERIESVSKFMEQINDTFKNLQK